MLISLVVPILNEENYLPDLLTSVFSQEFDGQFEIIVADGDSSDGSMEVARQWGVQAVACSRGRAVQLNRGAAAARGDVLFFVHADMVLPPGALQAISDRIQAGFDGGGFSNNFSGYNFKIKWGKRFFTFRWVKTDSPANKAFFGDNGIFVRRDVFEAMGGFKEMPIMEDFDFTRRLMKDYHVTRILSPRLMASPRRFEKKGYFRTHLLWYAIIILYRLGLPPERLARLYEDVR